MAENQEPKSAQHPLTPLLLGALAATAPFSIAVKIFIDGDTTAAQMLGAMFTFLGLLVAMAGAAQAAINAMRLGRARV